MLRRACDDTCWVPLLIVFRWTEKGLGTDLVVYLLNIMWSWKEIITHSDTFLKVTSPWGWVYEVYNQRVMSSGCDKLLHWGNPVLLCSTDFIFVCNDDINVWECTKQVHQGGKGDRCVYVCVCVFTGLYSGQYDQVMRWWSSNLGQGLLCLRPWHLAITTYSTPPTRPVLAAFLIVLFHPLLPPPISRCRRRSRRHTYYLHLLPTSFPGVEHC